MLEIEKRVTSFCSANLACYTVCSLLLLATSLSATNGNRTVERYRQSLFLLASIDIRYGVA